MLLTSTLSQDQLESWGWRIAFFIGGVLGLVGMWLRRSLVETEQFEENAEKARATKHPLLQTIKHHPKAVAQLCAFTLLSTLSYYTFFSALTPFAITFRDADKTDVFIALSIGTALFVALCYPFGALSDRFGGTAPLVITWLSNNGRPLWFFWYVAIAAAVAFLVILTLRETKGTELR